MKSDYLHNTRAVGFDALWVPLTLMAVLWTVVPAVVHTAPPLDVVESAMWGREWVVGTYKHPGMPSWFIEVGRTLNGGMIGWPAYAASQLFGLATLTLTYFFARDLAGARVATAAVLSLLPVEYFSFRSVEFNHTITQMPFWVGSAWCAWRAVHDRRLVWWLALGVMSALGLYAKLSNAMLMIVIAGWILGTAKGRATLATSGPWAGVAIFALLCAPLLRWLITSGFQPLEYASARGRDQSVTATLLFPANALLQAAPIGLSLALAGAIKRCDFSVRTVTARSEAQLFLLIMAIAPPLLSIVAALASGSGLRASWLAPAFPVISVLLASYIEPRLGDHVLVRLRRIAISIVVLFPVGYALAIAQLEHLSPLVPLRVVWPQAEIARALSAAWTAETDKPLKIIAGSSWAAGLVGINNPDKPSIFTEGIAAYSPWITPERLNRQGALVVWTEGRGSIATPILAKLVAERQVKKIHIPFAHNRTGQDLVVNYVVLKPN